jgi:hypothetical protein
LDLPGTRLVEEVSEYSNGAVFDSLNVRDLPRFGRGAADGGQRRIAESLAPPATSSARTAFSRSRGKPAQFAASRRVWKATK